VRAAKKEVRVGGVAGRTTPAPPAPGRHPFWARQAVAGLSGCQPMISCLQEGPPKPNPRFTRKDLKRIKQQGPSIEDLQVGGALHSPANLLARLVGLRLQQPGARCVVASAARSDESSSRGVAYTGSALTGRPLLALAPRRRLTLR
jgi:hypothetical protein